MVGHPEMAAVRSRLDTSRVMPVGIRLPGLAVTCGIQTVPEPYLPACTHSSLPPAGFHVSRPAGLLMLPPRRALCGHLPPSLPGAGATL